MLIMLVHAYYNLLRYIKIVSSLHYFGLESMSLSIFLW
jgi:hypothetical protein